MFGHSRRQIPRKRAVQPNQPIRHQNPILTPNLKTSMYLGRRLQFSFETRGAAAFGPHDVLHLMLEGEEMRFQHALVDLHEGRQFRDRHRRVQLQVRSDFLTKATCYGLTLRLPFNRKE